MSVLDNTETLIAILIGLGGLATGAWAIIKGHFNKERDLDGRFNNMEEGFTKTVSDVQKEFNTQLTLIRSDLTTVMVKIDVYWSTVRENAKLLMKDTTPEFDALISKLTRGMLTYDEALELEKMLYQKKVDLLADKQKGDEALATLQIVNQTIGWIEIIKSSHDAPTRGTLPRRAL